MAFDQLTGRWTPSQSLWDEYSALPSASPGGQALSEYWEERTPEEDWTRMMVDLPSDRRYRRGFESMRGRLGGRYLLAQPYIGMGRPGVGEVDAPGYTAPIAAESDPDTSFARFLQNIGSQPSYRASDIAALRARATMAGNLAMQPIGDAGEWVGDPVRQAYWGTFGPEAEDAFKNQVAVAQMLGRQRAGGGQFRGRLGSAIDRSISAAALARQARGAPETSFLNWYLGQTAPPVTGG